MKKYLIAIILAASIIPLSTVQAAVAPVDPRTLYAEGKPVKILIVPGHDTEYSGASNNGVKEEALNAIVAKKIATELSVDPKLSVTLARDEKGYLPELQKYFDRNHTGVKKFIASHKKIFERSVKKGTIELADVQVPHGDAPSEVAHRLYAINKWADEEGYSMVIHIHFNDYGAHKAGTVGEYGGFSIYAPETGLPNARSATPLAAAVGARLNNSIYTSDMPSELQKIDENGVIPDIKLIAMGSYGTLSIPSILVEGSYIYEPFVNPAVFPFTSGLISRGITFGLAEYLIGQEKSDHNLRYAFASPMKEDKSEKEKILSQDVMAMQLGLKELGYMDDMDRTTCPIDGLFSECTKTALIAFQKNYLLTADGIVGPKTLAQLNALFK